MDWIARRSGQVFFRYVWRFNALAIAIAGLMLIAIGIYAMLQIVKQETRDRRVTNVVNVGEQDKVAEHLVLGSAAIIDGTPYIRLPLYRSQSFSGSLYYDKNSDTNVVNYLFLDTSVNRPRWLFETGAQLIVSSHILFRQLRALPNQPRDAAGIVYTIVENDTNGDGRLTSKDAVSVAVSEADGGNYRKLLDGVGRLDAVEQIADDKLMLLYQKDQETILEIYRLPAMERLSQSTIPKIKLK